MKKLPYQIRSLIIGAVFSGRDGDWSSLVRLAAASREMQRDAVSATDVVLRNMSTGDLRKIPAYVRATRQLGRLGTVEWLRETAHGARVETLEGVVRELAARRQGERWMIDECGYRLHDLILIAGDSGDEARIASAMLDKLRVLVEGPVDDECASIQKEPMRSALLRIITPGRGKGSVHVIQEGADVRAEVTRFIEGSDSDYIGIWNTGAVKSMQNAFNIQGATTIVEMDLRFWDTRNVENMSYAFYGRLGPKCTGLESWNVARVTDMNYMFAGSEFNQDIGRWDTGGVVSMVGMFSEARAFNKDIGRWNTGKVERMMGVFFGALAFNQDISKWDTRKVRDMSGMFCGASEFNQAIGGWDTSRVTSMRYMFKYAHAFNQAIGGWDTSLVTDMSEMFDNASSFDQDIGKWDTSNVESMWRMFRSASKFNKSIGVWKTAKVEDMREMFDGACGFDQDIGKWDTRSVTLMGGMFRGATKFNRDIAMWDTKNTREMRHMFYNAASFDQDLRKWDTEKAKERCDSMFSSDSGIAMTMREKYKPLCGSVGPHFQKEKDPKGGCEVQ
jgi:surface protein